MGACQHNRTPLFVAPGAFYTLPNRSIQGGCDHIVGTAYWTGALALVDRLTCFSGLPNYIGTQEVLHNVTCGPLGRALLARARSRDTGAWGIAWKCTGDGDIMDGASKGKQAEERPPTSTISGICTEGRGKGGGLKHGHHTA